VHFLRYTDADYERLGGRIKCNPSIKAAPDRDGLMLALADSRLDILATDHAPHLLDEKAQPYTRCPSGIPLIQFALQSALEQVFDDRLTLERLVETTAHAPATLFAIKERGFLREGYFADLALIDLDTPQTVKPSDVISKCGWSPFEADTFRSSIAATWVNGHLAWDAGKLDDASRGQRLEFSR
jgi:dihydroorotase